MNACEYLAKIGYDALVGTPWLPSDPDDPQAIQEASKIDMERVAKRLIESTAKPLKDRSGVSWVRPITWPDRVPGLKTWSGQQSLDKLINSRVKMLAEGLRKDGGADLMTIRVSATGVTGIDSLSAPDTNDVGFSVDVHKMPVVQRVGLELLAIVGLESVPIVSFALRECGFLHAEKVWRFDVEPRSGGYYHRWGDVREDSQSMAYAGDW